MYTAESYTIYMYELWMVNLLTLRQDELRLNLSRFIKFKI